MYELVVNMNGEQLIVYIRRLRKSSTQQPFSGNIFPNKMKFYYLLIKIFYYWSWLIHDVILVSGEQQSDLTGHLFFLQPSSY